MKDGSVDALGTCPVTYVYGVNNLLAVKEYGSGVAQVVERRTPDSNDQRFEPRQLHKKIFVIFPSEKCCADSLSVCPTPVCYMHAYE